MEKIKYTSFRKDDEFILQLLEYHIITVLLTVVAAWKWGDWRNWSVYYPTMLFMVLWSVTYSLLTYNYPLWQFESPFLKTTISDLLVSFLAFPGVVLLYLTYLPKKLCWQLVYILAWVAYYTLVEWGSFRLGFLSYHNGWNLMWSVFFDLILFPMLWLHHKRPAYALPLSFVFAAVFLIYFKLPLSSMK